MLHKGILRYVSTNFRKILFSKELVDIIHADIKRILVVNKPSGLVIKLWRNWRRKWNVIYSWKKYKKIIVKYVIRLNILFGNDLDTNKQRKIFNEK